MLVDYHIHTPYCGHAQGKTIEYIRHAIACGFAEICFSDHLGRYYLTHIQRRRYWDWGMSEKTIGRYITELIELQKLFSDTITIKIGLEIDFVEGAEELLLPFINYYDFDFLLCSIHCLPRFGWMHLADYQEYNTTIVFKEYFRYARAALESGHFHSLAHMDFVWRYIQWSASESFTQLKEEIVSTVSTAKKENCCIEINANGYLWSSSHAAIKNTDPFDILVEECVNQDVPVTFGSDAHNPLSVGKAFNEIISALRSKGITTVATFDKGTRTLVPLG